MRTFHVVKPTARNQRRATALVISKIKIKIGAHPQSRRQQSRVWSVDIVQVADNRPLASTLHRTTVSIPGFPRIETGPAG